MEPLYDYLKVNHFWYYQVTNEGLYRYLGTHAKWSEYCFENEFLKQFSILRHPQTQKEGVSLMKNTSNEMYRDIQKHAWEKFRINFHLNLVIKSNTGMEAFGFASEVEQKEADNRILQELPLLKRFIQEFRRENKKLFEILEENPVNLSQYLGKQFYEEEKPFIEEKAKAHFLEKMGWNPIHKFTPLEKEVLAFAAEGYSAICIAEKLFLSKRTVENYLATIKEKLYCSSKDELIDQAKNLLTVF